MQPNILLLTDDQHRWDFYEDTAAVPSLRTPNLSRLRSQGTTFCNNYAVCPVCMPNRFSWCYGLYPSQAAYRLMNNAHDWPSPSHFPSMPQLLQRAGYHTALIGKLHSHAGIYSKDITVFEWQSRERGFDDVWEVSGKSLSYWFDCRFTHHLSQRGLLAVYRQDLERRNTQLGGHERYEASPLPLRDAMDSVIGDEAVSWLQSYDRDKPFFLHASLCGPHFPLDPPEELFARYRPEDMPAPVGVADSAAITRWKQNRALYCGLIELVDRQVGRLLDVLEQRGWLENTVVIYGSDHGDLIGDQGLNHKGLWHDASARTPLTIMAPGQTGGVHDAPAESVDLPATILDIAGSTGILPQSPGRSLWPRVRGQEEAGREWAYSECRNGSGEWRMIVDREWKYVYHATQGEMLFDRIQDPHDQTNVLGAHDADLGRMRLRMIESLRACVAPNTIPYFQTGER